MLTHPTRIALLVAFLVCLVGVGSAVSVVISIHYAMSLNHDWCTTLNLLTRAKYATKTGATFLSTLKGIEHDYHC